MQSGAEGGAGLTMDDAEEETPVRTIPIPLGPVGRSSGAIAKVRGDKKQSVDKFTGCGSLSATQTPVRILLSGALTDICVLSVFQVSELQGERTPHPPAACRRRPEAALSSWWVSQWVHHSPRPDPCGEQPGHQHPSEPSTTCSFHPRHHRSPVTTPADPSLIAASPFSNSATC